MKKVIIIATLFIVAFASKAQVNSNAVGVRFGTNGYISHAEISYQQKLTSINRVEADLGLAAHSDYSALSLVGVYHWVGDINHGLNWYAGPGAGIGFFSEDGSAYVNLGIGGQVGLEYDFNELDIPILATLDFRPMWTFVNYGGFGWGVALGIRYTF